MKLGDYIEIKEVYSEYDAKLNEVEVVQWIPLGKCIIVPNTSAKITKTNDGEEYIYSYEVIMKKPKSIIPSENKEVHIIKEDGTIDTICRVKGFVTMRNWLKIWL